jgi:hypothetical protein
MIDVNTDAYTNWEIPNAVTSKFAVEDPPPVPVLPPPIISMKILIYQPQLLKYKHPKQLSDFATNATPSAFAFVATSICCKHRMTSGSDKLSTKDARQ